MFIDNLYNAHPKDVLLKHGPTKLLVNKYHWHSPNAGIVASYTPNERDVHDHFGFFRGVDQIESFAQATTCSASIFLECEKLNCTPFELSQTFLPLFLGVGQVNFVGYLEKGDTFISIGNIKFYKFRQMVCDGRIYKCPKDIDLDEYFKDFTDKRSSEYDISADFTLVAELSGVTGRSVKIDTLNRN